MELRHIRAAIALAEELHFGRAAQRLRIAQSAMSQLIKALEQELDIELFARTKRSVRITSAGQRFVEGARRTLADLAETTASAQGIASGNGGRLVIQYVPPAALTELPSFVARFGRAAPAVDVVAESAPSAEQLDAIRAGRCDIGFVPIASTRRDLAPLAFKAFTRDPLVVLVASRHRLASRSWVQLADLRTERFVLFAQAGEPHIGAVFRKRCLEAGFDPNIVMEVSTTDALLGFVAAGVGVAFVPDLFAKLGFRGVRIVPVRPALHGGIAAVWHPSLISGAGRRFLATLPDVAGGRARRDDRG